MKRRATEMALSYINSDNYQASYNASLAMKEDDSSILAHVFKIVTDKSESSKVNFYPAETVEFWNGLNESPFKVSWSNIDLILSERLKSSSSAVQYLGDCFTRAYKKIQQFVNSSIEPPPSLLKSKSLIGHYCILLYTNPDLFFPNDETCISQFVYLVKNGIESYVSSTNHSLYLHSFLHNFSQILFHFSNSPSYLASIDNRPVSDVLSESLTKFVYSISSELAKDMRNLDLLNDKYLEPLKAFAALLDVPTLLVHFCLKIGFINSSLLGASMELDTLFGMFFMMSALPDEPNVGGRFFHNVITMSDAQRNEQKGILSEKLHNYHVPITRSAILAWIAAVVFGNRGRTRMRSNRQSLSSDGFLLNISFVLYLLLCDSDPFVDEAKSYNESLIDFNYCLLPSRFEVDDDTRMVAQSEEISSYVKSSRGFGFAHVPSLVRSNTSHNPSNNNQVINSSASSVAASAPVASPSLPPQPVPGSVAFSISASSALNPISPYIVPESVNLAVPTQLLSSSVNSSNVNSNAGSNATSPQTNALDFNSPNFFPMIPGPTQVSAVTNILDANSTTPALLSNEKDIIVSSPTKSMRHAVQASSVLSEHKLLNWKHIAPQQLSGTPCASCPELSSQADMAYLSTYCLPKTHHGIICDKQREKNWVGGRYKCINCKNYDLCQDCEVTDYEETIGKRADESVKFLCPYDSCHRAGSTDKYSEIELLDHIKHLHPTDPNLIVCPVCLANGNNGIIMAQPRFGEHLSKDHCDPHDSKNHIMLHIPAMLPHYLDRKFATVSEFKFLPDSVINSSLSASEYQSMVTHPLTSCRNCRISPIVGICYTCYHCSDYNLCQACYKSKDEVHSPAHFFMVFRRAIDRTSINFPNMPLLHPCGLVGSGGFSVQTELFFQSLTLYHLGLIRTCGRYSSLQSQLDLPELLGSHQHEALLKIQLSVESQLVPMLHPALRLYAELSKGVLHHLWPQNTSESQKCTIPAVIPFMISSLPEFFIDDMADLLVFISKYKRDVITYNMNSIHFSKNIVAICRTLVLFSSSSNTSRNPYLRSKLVDVLCGLAPTPTLHGPGCVELTSVFSTDPFMINCLLPSLFDLYNVVEHTGSGSELGVQFYDKFSVRFSVATLMIFILKFPSHQGTLEYLSNNSPSIILRFINCLLNDVTFLFDEAISKLTILQTLAKKKSEFMLESARVDYQSSLQLNERTMKTLSTFCKTIISLFELVGSLASLKSVACKPEMLSRVAFSINYFIVRLGELALSHLKNEEEQTPEEAEISRLSSLGFTPDIWAKQFFCMFMSFQDSQFGAAVVSDGRSYKPEFFDKVLNKLYLEAKISVPDYDSILTILDNFRSLSSESLNTLDISDAPEEYLDPIAATLMENPVTLPTSNVVMDRSVIMRHLLSVPTDPFNRAKLTVEMLIPNEELRLKIASWKSEKLNK